MGTFRKYQAFQSAYASGEDLEGKDRVVTVDFVQEEEVGKDQELKPVLHVVKDEFGTKPVILNRTNYRSIEKILGKGDENWHGGQVTIWPMPYEKEAGEISDVIRVRPKDYKPRNNPAGPPQRNGGPAAPRPIITSGPSTLRDRMDSLFDDPGDGRPEPPLPDAAE
jgi:hypothetical protein